MKMERREFTIVGSTHQPWEGANFKPGDKISFDVPVYNWFEKLWMRIRRWWYVRIVWRLK